MRLAVIPARGGSKRIPRKNVRPFAGRPMIARSIETARMSGLFDHVVVSTDDAEIAEISREAGAETPFVRPAELADDHTATRPVIQHAIRACAEAFGPAAHVCCIYATAPFLRASDLQAGLALVEAENRLYAFSATDYAFPIQRALRRSASGGVEMLDESHRLTRSQDLEETFHDAGQFYWGRAAAWLDNEPIFAPHSAPVILPRHRVHDIDTEEDWLLAELMFEALAVRERARTPA